MAKDRTRTYACARPGCPNTFTVPWPPVPGDRRRYCGDPECDRLRRGPPRSRRRRSSRPGRLVTAVTVTRACARPGCGNTFEVTGGKRKYCRTAECDRARQRTANSRFQRRYKARSNDPAALAAYRQLMNYAASGLAPWDEAPLSQLGLSSRAYNSLRRAGVETVRDLLKYGDDDLLDIRMLGWRQLEEIRGALSRYRREHVPPEPAEVTASWQAVVTADASLVT